MRKRTTTRHRRRTRRPARDSKRWVQTVKTVSTFPPEGLFTKDADTIARVLATKRVSPKGIGSGYKMLLYFINRGGRGIPSAAEPSSSARSASCAAAWPSDGTDPLPSEVSP
jgi:tRNA(adenine34) deaminase